MTDVLDKLITSISARADKVDINDEDKKILQK